MQTLKSYAEHLDSIFKPLFMKKLLIIISCLSIVLFMSCDERTSKRDALKQDIVDFNKNIKPIVLKTYYPEFYTETKTDSIISKTFEVSIKNYSIDGLGILINESIEGLQKASEYHRVFASDVTVAVSNKIIYDKHISVDSFEDLSNSEFWKNATLEHVWVNQEHSNSDQLSLGISFINPVHSTFKLYEMRIDNQGNERLMLIEDHS